MFEVTHFANPRLLWLLLVLVPVVANYVYQTLRGGSALVISTVSGLENRRKGWKFYARHLPFIFLCVAAALLVVAIARPQNSESGSKSTTEGIDIVLALDVSGSMLARDFQPDRISAAKEVAAKFVNDRPNDRIGLVVFAGESFTQCPLTSDKKVLLNLLSQVSLGMMDADGTAIGNGLATAVNRLRDSEATSKVIILLTDGVNNSGQIAPLTAAEIAKTYNIRVYTIGVGSRGMAPQPTYDIWGNVRYVQAKVEIDEDVLRKIATMTGGEYFRATDNNKLRDIYTRINDMERNKVEVDDYTRYNELYMGFALWGLALLVAAYALRIFVFHRIP